MAFNRNKIAYTAKPLPNAMDVPPEDMAARAERFRDVMANRHTIRDYSDEDIPQGVIEAAIRAAGNAPSGANHHPESVGIATGFLIAALHHAGLYCLTHTPNPMKFLGPLLGRPESEKPTMILVVGKAAKDILLRHFAA